MTPFAGLAMLLAQPAVAQSVLRDAETEAFFRDASAPLVEAAGLKPGNVDIVLLNDKSINAFVAGGQAIYIHSGLIRASDNVEQFQGVVAHELGHIAGGHIIRSSEGANAATSISILSLLLGAAAMAAGGGGDAGMAILMAGQQAAMGKYLAFSRAQESSADLAGASYLLKSHLSGRGSIEFFRKLMQEEYRYSSSYASLDPYAQTHPLSRDRIAILEDGYKASPYWTKPSDPALQARFLRIKAKLTGYLEDPVVTQRLYPESDQSVPAHYARAYAWHKAAWPDKAAAETGALMKIAPKDPYFLELQGQILLESGKPKEAIPALREAVARSNGEPLIAAILGHALIATEDDSNYAEAKKVLRIAVQRDNNNPFAWYQLGIVYEHEGDRPRAALATAERYSLEGQPGPAMHSAEAAMKGIPKDTPDWIRAQDIAMTSRDAMDDKKHKKR
ncbi:M48 family metalloprotease [Aquisediminimonas sediminicola]|uniref:M48 family metalloprotease n=1 Tax=Alteraquisediminimonas sediminicola TaxID=2676787 RepID=UPI001FE7A430|nr:M48 family metalloprotease [Aquisediminimonas sediminicola]